MPNLDFLREAKNEAADQPTKIPTEDPLPKEDTTPNSRKKSLRTLAPIVRTSQCEARW
jgi:hypothetical protein